MDLCPGLKIYERDKLKIIEYLENLEYYGSSARGSYHIAIYRDLGEVVDNNGSILINEVLKIDDSTYNVYATDYKFSNITGINIFKINISDGKINYHSIISGDIDISEFKLIDSLYYSNEHIYYNDIENNEVIIQVGDKKYKLVFKDDNLYHLNDF